jgi:hypothetical protein
LVNNAAFQEHVQKFEDLMEEHFDPTVKTNIYGRIIEYELELGFRKEDVARI